MDKLPKSRKSDRQIEAQANELLKTLWNKRLEHWDGNPPSDPVAIIDPVKALGLLGFTFSYAEDLGKYDGDNGFLKVAGTINRDTKIVQVSDHFPQSVRLFTVAHELGHAVMHDVGGTIHRDRPLDGAIASRDGMEVEADKFASFFLMPEKLVRSRFVEAFGTERFALNEDTAFALLCEPLSDVRNKLGRQRDLSRFLASAGSYNGRFFHSLANQFRVSFEAMAIRLEELSLIKP